MNRKTIQKVIDELSKDNPRLDYVRGILETLLESLPIEDINIYQNGITTTVHKVISPKIEIHKDEIDESAILENGALAILNRIDKSAIKTE